jgi:hypothetical protein
LKFPSRGPGALDGRFDYGRQLIRRRTPGQTPRIATAPVAILKKNTRQPALSGQLANPT